MTGKDGVVSVACLYRLYRPVSLPDNTIKAIQNDTDAMFVTPFTVDTVV